MIKNLRWRAQTIILRLFIAFCVLYTLVSLVLDYEDTESAGISVRVCSGVYIDADSEKELMRRLVQQFAPTFVFSVGEPVDLSEELIFPYQMVRDQEPSGRYVLRGAVTYPLDYGSTSLGVRLNMGSQGYSISLSRPVLRFIGWVFGQAHVDSHIGDVEMLELYLRPSEKDEGQWEIDSLVTFPHGTRKIYNASAINCFRGSPVIYISRGKHAMYPSLRECNQFSGVDRGGLRLTAEHCSVDELYYPSTAPEFDVGTSEDPVNIFQTSETLAEREMYQDEDVWGSCFFGGYGPTDPDQPCRSRFRWW